MNKSGPPAFLILSLVMKKPTDARRGSNKYFPIVDRNSEIPNGRKKVDKSEEMMNPGMK